LLRDGAAGPPLLRDGVAGPPLLRDGAAGPPLLRDGAAGEPKSPACASLRRGKGARRRRRPQNKAKQS
jgi:hypothetical protein